MRVTLSCPLCEADLDAEVLPTGPTWVPWGSTIVSLPAACEVDLPDACPNQCCWTPEDLDAMAEQAVDMAEEAEEEEEEDD